MSGWEHWLHHGLARSRSFAALAENLGLPDLDLDDLEVDPERDVQRAEAWLAGDLGFAEAHARAIHRQYPDFYRHLNVARNKAWIPRLSGLLASGTRAFILVGIGHLTGPESLLEQIRQAGLTEQRV